jgi:hypothetical protein
MEHTVENNKINELIDVIKWMKNNVLYHIKQNRIEW